MARFGGISLPFFSCVFTCVSVQHFTTFAPSRIRQCRSFWWQRKDNNKTETKHCGWGRTEHLITPAVSFMIAAGRSSFHYARYFPPPPPHPARKRIGRAHRFAVVSWWATVKSGRLALPTGCFVGSLKNKTKQNKETNERFTRPLSFSWKGDDKKNEPKVLCH